MSYSVNHNTKEIIRTIEDKLPINWRAVDKINICNQEECEKFISKGYKLLTNQS
jgi:hypothetical protein